MLGNVVCWGIAIGLMFSRTEGITNDYRKILIAMGFIFLGILSKAVDVYRDTHKLELDVDTDENGNIIVSKVEH